MIAVIGGSGFVGTRLCQRLQAGGREFVIIDKNRSADFPNHWVHGDVREIDSLRAAIPPGSIVVNLAAEHRDNVKPVSLYRDVNVTGAELVCAVAEELGCPGLIFTSSVACYGFAPSGTGEDGAIAPFNEYGRTKAEAEVIYRAWQKSSQDRRFLAIVRPTVIFGERNRGNVYNLIRQIASGRFLMIGQGKNVKSMAYVENIAAFLECCLSLPRGVHVYNYVDTPDLDMNSIVSIVRDKLGRGKGVGYRVPYSLGFLAGWVLDVISRLTGREFPLSAIRVRKFCGTTHFSSAAFSTGFVAPVSLIEGLERTVNYEFLEDNSGRNVFFTE